MKAVPLTLLLAAGALALSGQPSPKPVEAAPVQEVHFRPLSDLVDRSAEVAALQSEIESLRTELAQAKSENRPPAPPQERATYTVSAGGGSCANGSCGQGVRYARQERYYSGQRFASRTRFFDGDGRPFRKAR